MSINSTVREASRSYVEDGREFTLSYRLSSLIASDGREEKRSIAAFSVETSKASTRKESACSVQILNLCPETSLKLFLLIADAQSPVFPVHLPDIVTDHIHGLDFYEVSPNVGS